MNTSENKIFAFFSYVPFFGWLVPMGLKKDDRFVLSHAKQGFILAAFFTLFPILVYFAAITFVPSDLKIAKLVFLVIIYISHFLYFALCIFGLFLVKKNRFVFVPFVEKYYNKLDF